MLRGKGPYKSDNERYSYLELYISIPNQGGLPLKQLSISQQYNRFSTFVYTYNAMMQVNSKMLKLENIIKGLYYYNNMEQNDGRRKREGRKGKGSTNIPVSAKLYNF